MSSVGDGWRTVRLKRLVTLRAGDAITANRIAPEGDYPVYGGNGIRGYTSSFTHSGDHVLIGRQGALCGNVNRATGRFWASEHAVVGTPAVEVDIRWLAALLESMNLNQYSQSAAQPGLSVEVIANLAVSVPPAGNQRAVADYLERETTRIDSLIAAKRKLVGLVVEQQKQAVAYTLLGNPKPGCGPGVHQVTIRNGWRSVPFRWLFGEVDERSTTGSETLLAVSQTRGVIPQSELGDRRQYAETLVGYKICRPGDLVINRMWVYYGALGASQHHGLVSPDYAVFRPRAEMSSAFAAYVLRTEAYVAEMTRLVRGIGAAFQGSVRKPRLHPDELGLIAVPVPPSDQQEALLTVLDRQAADSEAKATLLQRSIDLLAERRQALITAAVAGQIEVPGAV